jgi:hypothetical protein
MTCPEKVSTCQQASGAVLRQSRDKLLQPSISICFL